MFDTDTRRHCAPGALRQLSRGRLRSRERADLLQQAHRVPVGSVFDDLAVPLEAAVRAGFRMPSFLEVLAPFAALRGHSGYERVLASVRESLREMASSPRGLAALQALDDLRVTLAALPVGER